MDESPIFSRTYDLLLWILPQVSRFPRVHRFGLGDRVTRLALNFQESLVAAGINPRSRQATLLNQADIELAQLRLWLRLCKDLEMLTIGQYEHVSRMLVEIGRLLGGWKKSLAITGPADERPGGAGRLVEQQSK